MTLPWRIMVTAIATLGLVTTASAHAFLDHARPAVGSATAAPPSEVQIWFTQPLESAFSSIQVLGPSGERVDHGQSRVASDEPTRLSVAVKALPPGRYRVIWRVLSVDSHVTNGDYTFTIGP